MIWFCLISFHTSDFNYFRMTGSLQNGVERPIANFLEYCRNGDLGGARFALKAGVDVNSRVMRRGFSGLMIAMSKNHNAMGRLLLEQAGVDVNMDCNGSTALHYAVHGNNAEGLRMLLDREDLDCVNRVDKLDCTPLKLALAYNSVDCLSLLLADKRCDSNIKDDWDLTTLMFAVKNDVPSCLSLLLEAPQVDPNLKNKREGSPLMMAVKLNKTKVLPFLLACPRVDLDKRDGHRRTARERLRCQINIQSQIWPPDGATCISCKFCHQLAQIALVQNLVIRWRHLHCLQSLPQGSVTCIATLCYWHYQ